MTDSNGAPGSKAADVNRYLKVARARDRAVEQTVVIVPRAKAFLEPREHKAVTTAMFSEYLIVPEDEQKVALEFFRAYRHLFEGGALTDLPISLINRSSLIARVKASLRGQPILDEG
jgi:hypothetical protein